MLSMCGKNTLRNVTLRKKIATTVVRKVVFERHAEQNGDIKVWRNNSKINEHLVQANVSQTTKYLGQD